MFWLDTALSYSYNSYTGSVLSTQGGVCIGNAQIACAGIENGYSAYWDSYGNFVGATTFVELYAQVAGGIGRASAGYEWGLLGMEERDFYVGANVAGIHGELSHIGGGDGKKMDASWGFEEKFYYKLKNEGKDPLTGKSRKYVGWQLGPFDIWYDHGNRNDNQPSFMNLDEFEEYANDSKNNMKFGEYPKSQSKYHHGTKMWMAKTAPLHFLWFDFSCFT